MDFQKHLQVLQNASNAIQKGQNVQQQNVILNKFKNASFKYPFFLQAFEKSTDPHCKFLCLVLLRHTILRDFFSVSIKEKEKISKYLLEAVFKSKVRAVQNALIQIYVIMQKLMWKDNPGIKKQQFQKIQVILSDKRVTNLVELPRQYLIGIEIRKGLINEFSLSSKCSSIGMSLEFHEQSKVMFQKEFLSLIWGQTIFLIKRFHQNFPILRNLLDLLLLVLLWDFNNENGGNFVDSRVLNPRGLQFRKLLIDLDIIKFLFQIHGKVKPEISHLIRQIFVHLSNISMNIFVDDSHRKNYFTMLLNGTFHILQTDFEKCGKEQALDYVMIINQLFLSFRLKNFLNLAVFRNTIEKLAKFSLRLVKNFNHSGCYEKIFNAWGTLLMDIDKIMFNKQVTMQIGAMKNYCAKIYEDFTQKTILEFRNVGEPILINLSLLGRQDSLKSLSLIRQLLQKNFDSVKNNPNTNKWKRCYLLIRMLGYLICDNFENETPVPPRSIIYYTTKKNKPEENEFVKVIVLVLSIIKYEQKCILSNKKSLLNGQCTQILIWFLSRFCQTYLMVNVQHYRCTSPLLSSMFGKNTVNGGKVADLIFEKSIVNILHFQEIDALMMENLNFLLSVTSRIDGLTSYWCKSANWSKLISISSSSHKLKCSNQAKSRIIEILLQASRVIYKQNKQTCQRYIQGILVPIKNNIMGNMKSFPQFVYFINICFGIARSIHRGNSSILFKVFFEGLLLDLKKMVAQNRQGNVYLYVLKFYELVFKKMFYYTNAHKTYFGGHCIATMELCMKDFHKKKSNNAKELAEERYHAVLTIVKLVKHLSQGDFMNEKDPNTVKYVFHGLRIVLPLINEENLKIPKLCRKYFLLIRDVLDSFPAAIDKLPDKFFKKVMESLLAGIKHPVNETILASHKSLEYISRARIEKGFFKNKVSLEKNTLEKMLNHILFDDFFDFSTFETMSVAVFGWIIWNQKNGYEEVVRKVVSKVDASNKPKLIQYFVELIDWRRATLQYENVVHFKKRMKKFVIGVRSLLQTK